MEKLTSAQKRRAGVEHLRRAAEAVREAARCCAAQPVKQEKLEAYAAEIEAAADTLARRAGAN